MRAGVYIPFNPWRKTMLYDVLKTVHVLSIVLWVGGMMFAHWFLRPAALQLDSESRFRLMQDVMGRFFKAVLIASLLVLVTGFWMIGRVAKQTVQAGLSFEMPLSWTIMSILGTIMVAIFMHIRFALYKRLREAVQFATWDKAAAASASIRTWVAVNLGLGILIVLVALLGA
jgi:uncharacterized membrane protein